MPTLAPQERLQPALLDRLIDDEPDKQMESRESRLISVRKLRECVLRDLAWLFNCARLTEDELDHDQYPEVAGSVLNFGLPPMSGNTATSIDPATLEIAIRDAVIRFEPRLVEASLQIRAIVNEHSMDHHNQIQVQIKGSLWSVPVPIELLLRTNLDLESGEVRIEEVSG